MILKNRQVGEKPLILPRVNSRIEPQHLLLAILGDYWFEQHQPLPSAALLDSLALFDVKESSARQAMRRLALKEHLVMYRDGRTTSYGFPERSEAIIRMRQRSVVGFGQDGDPWNGCFTVVVFSIPEAQRDTRRELRTHLLSLGFGNLHDAVWVSPHDVRDDALDLLQELDVPKGSVFYGPEKGTRDAVGLVSEAFDTKLIRDMYEEFITEYSHLAANSAEALEMPLVTRTLMVNKWLTLRTVDPNLPREVLPDDWPRSEAHGIFLSLYDELGGDASKQFRDIVAMHDPDKAELVAYFTSEILQS